MANGHNPSRPSGQGGMAQPSTQQPKTSTNHDSKPAKGEIKTGTRVNPV